MKKSIIAIMFIVASLQANAQQAGLKVGGNMSKYSDNVPDIVYKYKPGYQLGAWYRQPIKNQWGFCAELSLFVEGYRYDYTGPNTPIYGPGQYDKTFNFINVPLLATYQLSPKWGIEVGSSTHVFIPKDKFYKDHSKVTLGALAGVYAQLSKKMAVNLRFEKGITRAAPDVLKDLNRQSHNVQFSLYYAFCSK